MIHPIAYTVVIAIHKIALVLFCSLSERHAFTGPAIQRMGRIEQSAITATFSMLLRGDMPSVASIVKNKYNAGKKSMSWKTVYIQSQVCIVLPAGFELQSYYK